MTWSQFTVFEHGGKAFIPRDVPGDGNCFFHCAALSPLVPLGDFASIRRSLCNFAMGSGRNVAEKVYELLETPERTGPVSSMYAVNAMDRSGTYAANFEMVLLSLVFEIDVVTYSNLTTGIETFSCAAFLRDHMADHALTSDFCLSVYHHQFMRPLAPVPPS
jgi:hypothetical protein